MENKYTDIIFDIETLGNSGKFAVISIAFIPFCIATREVGDGVIFKVSLEDSIKNGFEVNDSTVQWWLDKDKDIDVLRDLLSSSSSLKETCEKIQNYLEQYKVDRFWASATLDYQGIENLFSSCSMKNPILYNQRLCLRTVRELSKTKQEYVYPQYNHNPIEDCKSELNEFFDQLDILNIKF